MDSIGTIIFFQLWCEACSFSKMFSRKTTFLCFFGPSTHFSSFVWNKKEAQWNLAKIGPNESPWTPIIDHLVQFWIMSVPKQPPLKLKPANLNKALAGEAEARTRMQYQENEKNDYMVQNNSKMLIFVKTNLWEATCLTPKLEK